MELFWDTIADYNRNTWVAQGAISLLGAVLVTLLFNRPSPAVKRAMKCYIVMLNLWIALVYYLYFCHQRPYNYATVLIWLIMAAIWIYDVATGYTAFERNRKHERLATLFMLLPLTFPLISAARGMHYPMMASPVMPSSVALFTIGFMLAFSQRVNLFIVLFLCHWALEHRRYMHTTYPKMRCSPAQSCPRYISSCASMSRRTSRHTASPTPERQTYCS